MRWTVLFLTLLFTLAGCLDGGDAPDNSDDTGDGGNENGGDTTPGGAGDGTDDGTDDGADDSTTPEPVTIDISTTGAYPVNIAFDPSSVSVPQGAEVTVRFTNADDNTLVGHDWAVEGFEDATKTGTASNGQTVEVTFTADMEPGDYSFYCTIGDHREQGMEGTFTVTA